MKPAIQVEGLSKAYRISGRASGEYRTLRESLSDVALTPWRRVRRLVSSRAGLQSNASQTVQALDNVSFAVRRGEVLGVIGRNGAGKSTLLKVISQITEPTAGRVTLRGRLASLLEVGTGFHQELTGRENVYLSGAILGMSKRQLNRQFDAIVEFAEIGAFIDTPVKRYSSGMLVRLAFAVAAHLEPDILLLDEVLAVGDAGFRAKCIRRMKELISSDVAVVFVSHQRSQIAEVCNRCVVLHNGRLVYSGDPQPAWERYVASLQNTTNADPRDAASTDAAIEGLDLFNAAGAAITLVPAHEPVTFTITYRLHRPIADLGIGLNFFEGNGHNITDCTTLQEATEAPSVAGRHQVSLEVNGLPFAGGGYAVVVRLYDVRSGMPLSRRLFPLLIDGPASQYAITLSSQWRTNTIPNR